MNTKSNSEALPPTAGSASLIADPEGKHLAVCRLQLASVVKERDELAGYLCRIKLPLSVRFLADLAKVFPGKNVRMKDEGGYLCIFSENAQGDGARHQPPIAP